VLPTSDAGLLGLLGLGFGLGLVHALDADHIMAVSALATSRPGLRECLRFALRWALGHGGTLLGVGGAAFALGLAIPASFARAAELAVGLMMIGLGAWVLRDALRQRAHLHFHRHDGVPVHAHWHIHAPHAAHAADAHRHGHGAVLVGALHGTAGSAPLLALLPAVAEGSAAVGLAYLVAFSAGVLVAMLAFGGLFGALLQRAVRSGRLWPFRLMRGGTAFGCVAVGIYLVRSSL
jgi:sulfite exporter TauE/SafE